MDVMRRTVEARQERVAASMRKDSLVYLPKNCITCCWVTLISVFGILFGGISMVLNFVGKCLINVATFANRFSILVITKLETRSAELVG